MVCDFCSSRIQEHLAKKNYIAKSNTLGGWLLNSKKTGNSSHRPSKLFLWLRLFIWGLRGMGWWIVTFSVILYYILGFFIPDVFLKSAFQITPFWNIKDFSQCLIICYDKSLSFNHCLFLYKLFVRKLILWGIFVILWDYTWVSQISKPDYRISGKKYYYQPTGLEAIFSPALRLDDEPLIVRALRVVKRRKLSWIEIFLLLWTFEIAHSA
ncbi:hypothetical protein PCK2_000660 [Pneumocystis canis]|nr:hypothetical protein PCK2_000660 [Pneumocystis canis]